MQRLNYEKYIKMWHDFADKKSKAYLSGSKYSLSNIVGLTGMARENEIFRLLDLRHSGVFIDVGCASGRQVFIAARQCSKAVGIDVGEDFIKTAKQSAKDDNITNVEFILTKGNRIPFQDNTFDKLICSEVLEHVPDHHALLDELIRVVRPGGVMVFTVPNWNSRGTLYKRIKNGFRPFPFTPITDFSMEGIEAHGDAHVRQFSVPTFSAFVRQHGLQIEYVGGASFIDGPKVGPIIVIVNRLRLMQQLTFVFEKFFARISKSLGRHIVLRARKSFS